MTTVDSCVAPRDVDVEERKVVKVTREVEVSLAGVHREVTITHYDDGTWEYEHAAPVLPASSADVLAMKFYFYLCDRTYSDDAERLHEVNDRIWSGTLTAGDRELLSAGGFLREPSA